MSRNQSINTVIGLNLRKLRSASSMSQAEMATLLGVTYQQIQKYETGKNSLSIEKLCVLTDYFNLPLEYFISAPTKTETADKLPFCMDALTLELLFKLRSLDNQPLKEKIGRIIDILAA